jgi:hypothetical protein
MNNRRSERLTDSLDVEVIAGGVSYSGLVLNFSAEGLYMVTATTYDVVAIPPSSQVELKCKLPNGENIVMNCEVKWFQTKPSPYGVSFSMGMEINDPPKEYTEYLKTLQ